ncbi:hypothetical protein ACHAXN_005790 [Cyclotella atomus]
MKLLNNSCIRAATCSICLALLSVALILKTSSSLSPQLNQNPHPRSKFLRDFSGVITFGLGGTGAAKPGFTMSTSANEQSTSTNQVVYEPITIDVLGEEVPVAAWYPTTLNEVTSNQFSSKKVVYDHRISVKKIGKSLAGWNFIPEFTTRTFPISASGDIMQINSIATVPNFASSTVPVVLLAHGYLGSRFDLSPYAQDLASNGFLVLSPEYPESLADSYDSMTKPIDRTIITNMLLQNLKQWEVNAVSYSIIGHSLGCGTAIKTGDDSWTRVCIAGFPSSGSKCLFIGSTNDGAVPLSRAADALQSLNYNVLSEKVVRMQTWEKLAPRTSLIFNEVYNGSPPPNHISFLSEGTNAAMIDFLSPLLPLARYLEIPVLDFDKYQLSRDSDVTGEVVRPLVVDYLLQMSSR